VRERSQSRIEAQNKHNYPLASNIVLRSLMAKDLMNVESNEIRFIGRKPFKVSMKKRDDHNRHFIRHPEDQLRVKTF